jgi:hypothetical protein
MMVKQRKSKTRIRPGEEVPAEGVYKAGRRRVKLDKGTTAPPTPKRQQSWTQLVNFDAKD